MSQLQLDSKRSIEFESFHFRNAGSILVQVVHHITGNRGLVIQNPQAALAEIAKWKTVAQLLDPEDLNFGAMSEEAFLLFFGLLIHPLEGTIMPRKKGPSSKDFAELQRQLTEALIRAQNEELSKTSSRQWSAPCNQSWSVRPQLCVSEMMPSWL